MLAGIRTIQHVRLTTIVALAVVTGLASLNAAVVYEVYEVKAGDTLNHIASKFSTTTDNIRRRNNMSPEAVIYVGQTLVIPAGMTTSETEQSNIEPPKPNIVKQQPKQTSAQQNSSTTSTKQQSVGRLGTIVGQGAHIRSRRSPTARVYYSPKPGLQVVVTQQDNDWYGVLMSNLATGWIPAKYVRVESVELIGNLNFGSGNGVVQEAMRYLGVPYQYGGNTAGGIDCSALVKRAYLASRGISLPRTAAEQARVGQEVPVDQLQPGDRLYFSRSETRIDHCGIYFGNGQFIHASGAADQVTISSLYEPKYSKWFRIARR